VLYFKSRLLRDDLKSVQNKPAFQHLELEEAEKQEKERVRREIFIILFTVLEFFLYSQCIVFMQLSSTSVRIFEYAGTLHGQYVPYASFLGILVIIGLAKIVGSILMFLAKCDPCCFLDRGQSNNWKAESDEQ